MVVPKITLETVGELFKATMFIGLTLPSKTSKLRFVRVR